MLNQIVYGLLFGFNMLVVIWLSMCLAFLVFLLLRTWEDAPFSKFFVNGKYERPPEHPEVSGDIMDRLRQAKPVKRGSVSFFETFHQKPVGNQTYPGKPNQHPEPSVA